MPVGITGRIYVSGSNLWWEDNEFTVDSRRNPAPQGYRFTGALPNPSIFSGQPAGRIWVASGSGDTSLYYSDAAGVTRFIAGRKRGSATSVPLGRVFAQRKNKVRFTEPLQPATDLYWTALSGSTVTYFSAKNDTSLDPLDATLKLTVEAGGGRPAIVGELTRPLNFDLHVFGPIATFYSSSNCSSPLESYSVTTDIVIPAGRTITFQCFDYEVGTGTTARYASASTGCGVFNPPLCNGDCDSWQFSDKDNSGGSSCTLGAFTGSSVPYGTTSAYTLGGQYYTSSASEFTTALGGVTNSGGSGSAEFWSHGIDEVEVYLYNLNCIGAGASPPPAPFSCPSGQYQCGGSTLCCDNTDSCCSYNGTNYCCPDGTFCNPGGTTCLL